MKTTLPALIAAVLLSACANSPPAPEWQGNSFSALNAYSSAYLSGNTRVADFEFNRAKLAISSTGRADLMARAELLRCATQVASLVLTPCAAYNALASLAKPEEQAYATFISAHWSGLNAEQLPVQYRGLLASKPPVSNNLSQIQDPLSRLIAAGVLLQKELLTPVDIALAVETASNQGWRRPLLAWLGVQLKRAKTAGDASAAVLQQRIDLVLQAKAD
jgi:hypothetical protein